MALADCAQFSSRADVPRPRVCVCLPHGGAYCRGVLLGISRYVHQCGPFTLVIHDGRPTKAIVSSNRPFDGILTLAPDEATLTEIRAGGQPVVSVEACSLSVPQVIPDDRAIGALALDHLADQGLRDAAYVTSLQATFSENRRHGFCAAAATRGLRVRSNNIDDPASMTDDRRRQRWLAGLPRPVGIFAFVAGMAQTILSDLADIGRDVPEDAAVITAELDELVAGLTSPAITAIDMNTARIGYRAAEMLHRRIVHDPPAETTVVVPPLRVVERGSTDLLHVSDPIVGTALRYIRQTASAGIGVADVLRHLPASRRSIEIRFARVVGRSIHKEIVRARLAEAKRLLAHTNLALADIAVRVGYEHASTLCKVFRRELGLSPSAFRSQPKGDSR